MRYMNEDTLEHIRQRILYHSNIDVKEPSRKREYVYARIVFVKIMRDEFFECTFEEISKFLGKNHSTLIYAYNKFYTIEKYEPKYYRMYKLLLIELEQEHLIIKSKVFGKLEQEKEIAYAREVVIDVMEKAKEEIKKLKYEAVID